MTYGNESFVSVKALNYLSQENSIIFSPFCKSIMVGGAHSI